MTALSLLFLFACSSEPEATPEPAPEPAPAEEEPEEEGEGKGAKSIDCKATGYTLGGKVGDKMVVKCPSGCDSSGSVWGDLRYTPDSAICKAAIHAGAIPASGGKAQVQFKEKFGPFEGAEKHGVTSNPWSTPSEPSLVIKGKKK
jgi:hypothetical protein